MTSLMVIRRLALCAILLVALTAPSEAQRGRGGRSHSSRSSTSRSYRAPRATRSYRAPRVSHSTRAYRAPRANTAHRASVHASSRPRSYTPRISRRTLTATVGVARDSRGRIRRSASAKRDFMRSTGFSRGRPGYVVDHVRPLACGGADTPSNMRWQTRAAARAKDRTERIGCGSRSRRR